ncbi:glutathione S-transferase family protein [Rhodobacter sp. KR11]|jgi:GST-like protein|uniref:glutathione S-transferase family protein n=1 Tax=Rhodobacter sp. KR11 TaxID=2974588 RepID=UPI0022218278|nr:glutathione S-transferase family protein [Rhodobacter sp. KR11]MCW1918267.1 glutathione S-transferase family protein [Rhodobacter sp. KR11]
MIRLYENPGWGSAIVELQLALYDLPHDLVRAGNIHQDPVARAALGRVNPLIQVPTLVLPDGEVMTESAAITLVLADLAKSDLLVPKARTKHRASFYRWLIFLVASIYPSFVYSDTPERFVKGNGGEAYQVNVIEHRKAMWKVMEAEAARRGGPWFLGDQLTAIDIFLACMVHWRPKEEWFQAETPHLWRAAEEAAKLPALRAAYHRNFG